MATAPIPADLKTARKWVRAYVALGMAPGKDTLRRLERMDRLAQAMAHWYSDDLEDFDCPCEACDWWRESIRAHVVARK